MSEQHSLSLKIGRPSNYGDSLIQPISLTFDVSASDLLQCVGMLLVQLPDDLLWAFKQALSGSDA